MSRLNFGIGNRQTRARCSAMRAGCRPARPAGASLQAALAGEWVPYRLFLGVTRQGAPFIWRVRLPGEDGRSNSWSESAMEASAIAKDRWVRVVPDMALGGYVCHIAPGDLGEPIWPEEGFAELLKIAFRGRVVDSADHPLIARLRGEG